MADETTEERETGVESISCPNCGKKLNPVDQLADGGQAYETCSKCYPKATKAAVKEQAEAQAARAFPRRETGTNTEDTNG